MTGNGTYTVALSALTSAGTVSDSLTFTDAAGNSFPATGNSVTLVSGNVPVLVAGSFTASASKHDVLGLVSDPTIGTITISAYDNTSATLLGTTTVSETATNAPVSFTITMAKFAFTNNDVIVVTAWESTGGTGTATIIAQAPAGAAGSSINLALALTDPSVAAGESVTVTIAGVPAGWSLNAGPDLGNGTWVEQGTDLAALAITAPAGFAGAVVLAVTERWTNPNGSVGSMFVADNVEAYAPGAPIFALSGNDTLTGSGTNDLFVFAQPIGNDRIFNFNPASSQIDLVGFVGIANFADLQANIANDAQGNAVITLGSGETIIVAGVDAASLSAANFLFNQEPVTNNPGTMTIADGAMMPMGGTIDNGGTIALASTGGGTELEIQARGVTLQGGGQLALSDNSQDLVTGGGQITLLSNVDNTISGAGQIGGGQLALANNAVIDASGANALTIDTGGNIVANSGTLEATGSGRLTVNSAVANSGLIWADGGNVVIAGAVSGGGSAAGTLTLDQSAGFSGTIAGFVSGDAIDLTDLGFGVGSLLSYTENSAGTGGTLVVSDASQSASLALVGQYAQSDFQMLGDATGGTLIHHT